MLEPNTLLHSHIERYSWSASSPRFPGVMNCANASRLSWASTRSAPTGPDGNAHRRLWLASVVALVDIAGGFFFSFLVWQLTPGAFGGPMTILMDCPTLTSLIRTSLFGSETSQTACYKDILVKNRPAGMWVTP
jgi:hypothetical protein